MIKEKLDKYRKNFHQIRRHYLQIRDDPLPIYGPSVILDNEKERNRQQIETLRKKVQRLVAIMRSVPEGLRLTIMKEDEKNYAPNELTHSQIMKDINDLMEEITAVLRRQPETTVAEKTPAAAKTSVAETTTSSDKKSLSRKRKRGVNETFSTMNSVVRQMYKERDYKFLSNETFIFNTLVENVGLQIYQIVLGNRYFSFFLCHLCQAP